MILPKNASKKIVYILALALGLGQAGLFCMKKQDNPEQKKNEIIQKNLLNKLCADVLGEVLQHLFVYDILQLRLVNSETKKRIDFYFSQPKGHTPRMLITERLVCSRFRWRLLEEFLKRFQGELSVIFACQKKQPKSETKSLELCRLDKINVGVVKPLFRLVNLKDVCFEKCNITSEDLKHLPQCLKKLTFENCTLSGDASEAFENLCELRELSFKDTLFENCSSDDSNFLTSIAKSKSLRNIHFIDCAFDCVMNYGDLKKLENIPTLQKVYLSVCEKDAECVVVCYYMKTLEEELELKKICCTVQGLKETNCCTVQGLKETNFGVGWRLKGDLDCE